MAWILIVFLIILGGLIAPFGDLLGTKIGKARFSILKLRPKKTATIITIITGSFISAISIGFMILVFGTLVYNEIIEIPIKFMNQNTKKNINFRQENSNSENLK